MSTVWSTGVNIVAATEVDVPTILEMIRGLAEYEKLASQVTIKLANLEWKYIL